MVFNKILDSFRLPQVKDIDYYNGSVISLHKEIIQQKGFLRKLYADWYDEFKKEIPTVSGGSFVELGSGGGFIKSIMPEVISSDIIYISGLDLVFSAEKLPFKDKSIRIFFMLDVLHHISKPSAFLKEAERCLTPGGKIIMIEPANTLWGRFIYKNFHHEDFDISTGWGIRGERNSSLGNGAVSWIIFFRDRKIFSKEFSSLRIRKLEFHTPLRYLISGGFSVKQLLPSCAYNIIRGIESIIAPFNNFLGMFMTISLEKRK